MTRFCPTSTVLWLALIPGWALFAQSPEAPSAQQEEPAQTIDFHVYTEAPRLLLGMRHLRLLKRERERQSMRWQQFAALMEGHAQMPEPGLALALYGIVAANKASCEEAAAWASTKANPAQANDLRQIAMVSDWCGPQLREEMQKTLLRRLHPALASRPTGAREMRSAVFAAIAASEAEPAASAELLRYAVEQWWRKGIVPKLKAGEDPFHSRAELLAQVEILHVIHDNLQADLRDDAIRWFNELPPRLVLAYYPAAFPAPENDYRVPAYAGDGEPDLSESIYARALEFELVSLDPNSQPTQFLQGWLMQDRYVMRSPLGAPYELMWANPYLPGLSYAYMPDLYHASGRLFARSSWDDDATWFGSWDKEIQLYQNGQRFTVKASSAHPPIGLGPVRVFFGSAETRFDTGWWKRPDEDSKAVPQVAFVVGLAPSTLYDVEVDGEEMDDDRTDKAGILELRFAPEHHAGVRVRKAFIEK